MTKTEITTETLTDIITAAGHSPRHFDIKATLKDITAYYEDEDNTEALDIETVTEWLDETGTTGTTYQLCPWLAA